MNDISLEVFQRKIWTWMEEKGILSKIKIQLRQQMINVLKGTELERDVSSNIKLKPSLSPKYKGINLLIAEYLLQQGYQYTLSIFTSEDPTISLIDDNHSPTLDSHHDKMLFKFTNDDVCDILESLGFSRDVLETHDICNLYKETNLESLIICLFRCLSFTLNKLKSNVSNRNTTDFPKDSIIQKNSVSTQTCSRNYNVNENNLNINEADFKNYKEMKNIFDNELEMAIKIEQVKSQQLNEFHRLQMITELQKEKEKFKKREQKFRIKLLQEFKIEQDKLLERERLKEIEIENELHRDLELERRKLFEEFQMRSRHENINSKTLAELQQSSLEIAMKAVQYQSNKLRKKEDLLNKKHSELANTNTRKVLINSSCQTDTITATKVGCNCNNYNDSNLSKKYANKELQTIETNSLNKEIQTFPIEKLSKHSQTFSKDDLATEYHHKNNQTLKLDTSSVGCQTIEYIHPLKSEYIKEEFKNEVDTIPPDSINLIDKNVQTVKLSDDDPINLLSMNYSRKNSSVKNVLKKLHSENVYFKAYNEQQRLHIEELTKKMLNDDVRKSQIESQRYCKSEMPTNKTNNFSNTDCVESYNDIYVKKEDLSSTDEGIDKIKETLEKLEREGEELENSYCMFKKRQSECIRNSNRKYSSQTNVYHSNPILYQDDDCYKSLPIIPSSRKHMYVKNFSKTHKICNLKDEQTFSCDYLDRNYVDNADSSKYNRMRRVQEPSMKLDASIFQNYIIASRDVKQYNVNNPKLFGDMLIQRNYGIRIDENNTNLSSVQEINNHPKYNEKYSNQRRKLLDLAKYQNVRRYSTNKSNDENKKNSSLANEDEHSLKQLYTNNSKYRRWSLPSAVYRKSPLSYKGRSSLCEVRQNSNIRKKLFKEDIGEKLNTVILTKNLLSEHDNQISIDDRKSIKNELDLEPEDIDIIKSESIVEKLESDPEINPDVLPSASVYNSDILIGNDIKDTSNQNETEAKPPDTDDKLIPELDRIHIVEIHDVPDIVNGSGIDCSMIQDDVKSYNVTDCVENKNKTSSSDEVSAISEDVIVPSSLEMSDHSHVSVPHVSEDNDSFWK